MKHILLYAALIGATMSAPVVQAKDKPAAPKPDDYPARVAAVLKATPLIDGHNDWAEMLRDAGDARWTMDLTHGLDQTKPSYNTDIARLRKGMVGGQFWSVFVSANLPGLE